MTWNLSGLCYAYPDESSDDHAPTLPCLSLLRWAIQEVVKYTCLIWMEVALLLCGPGISPLLTQPSSSSSVWEGTDPGTVSCAKLITLEPLVHTVCPEPWFQTTTRGPKEEGRKGSQDVVGSREQEIKMEMQTFRPPSLP